jgi:hypothetical protein
MRSVELPPPFPKADNGAALMHAVAGAVCADCTAGSQIPSRLRVLVSSSWKGSRGIFRCSETTRFTSDNIRGRLCARRVIELVNTKIVFHAGGYRFTVSYAHMTRYLLAPQAILTTRPTRQTIGVRPPWNRVCPITFSHNSGDCWWCWSFQHCVRWTTATSSQRKCINSYLKRCRLNPRHSQLNLEGHLPLPV